MEYRLATLADIPQIEKLQQKYHINSIAEEDRADGFVTTYFNAVRLQSLIEDEAGVAIALDGDKVVGYATAASWQFWAQWPLFQVMIDDLQNMVYLGRQLNTENSYQYGPVAVDKEYRSTGVFPNLFETSRREMSQRYPVLVTFINTINGRSLRAHEKLQLDIIKPFKFQGNNLVALGYDTSKRTPGSTI
ncbi:MAG TPA: GNAT family acetyltransferase [Clostridiaceae bacterium]|nr:GNAT family acetyltransferase [Clostridiaceae bacterium]